ncbi:MAG: hypothetical protein WBF11_07735 [Methyloceanibacter sp.]
MSRRTRFVMAAFAALVAGTLLIVYAYRGEHASPDPAEASEGLSRSAEIIQDQPLALAEAAKPKDQAPIPDAVPAKPGEIAAPAEAAAPPPTGSAHQVLYDFGALPAPIRSTLEGIVVAAQSGDIDDMLPVLEENELPPMLSATLVSDPIAFWKKNSVDGEGRDILAAMMNVFSSGFVRMGEGKDAMYVWPYFAEMDLTKLTPAQEVELYRIVPAAQALEMQKSGKYTYYRAGIGGDGVWHYFLQ